MAAGRRKISEAFLEFSLPILRGMTIDTSEQEIEHVLKLAFTVWNSVIMDQVNGNDRWIEYLQELMAEDPLTWAIVTDLIHRKRTLFGDEKLLIGNYRVTRKGDELNLWAEAREAVKSDGPRRAHGPKTRASPKRVPRKGR